MKRLVVSLTLAALLQPALGQTIYQSKDANGNPVFTDQPKPGAKEVEIKSINTTPALTPTGTPMQPSDAAFKGYSRIAVSVPSTIPNGLTPTTVGISTEPQLQPGHSWELKLDGAVVATGVEASATIPQIERGNHTFQVDIISAQGLIGSSDPVEVFVFWPSKNR